MMTLPGVFTFSTAAEELGERLELSPVIMAAERLPRANSPLDTRAVDQLTLCPLTDRRDSNSKDKLARLWGPKESASTTEGQQARLWEPGPSQSCLSYDAGVRTSTDPRASATAWYQNGDLVTVWGAWGCYRGHGCR